MKTHLALYLQAQNADASHTQDLAKLAWLRRPRLCISIGELFAFALWRGLRHGYVSPRPCSSRSLCDWDTLPFNLLMRNFKRNSACYEQPRRNFDRIELRRRSRRKDKNSKRDRRSRADSVETLRMRSICVLNRLFDPHLCPKPQKKTDISYRGFRDWSERRDLNPRPFAPEPESRTPEYPLFSIVSALQPCV